MVANGSSCFSLRTSIAPEIWWRVAGHDNVDDTFSREPFGHRSGGADLFLVAADLGGSDAPGQCNLEPKWTLEKRDEGRQRWHFGENKNHFVETLHQECV